MGPQSLDSRKSRKLIWLLLFLLVIVSLLTVVVPALLIQPFRPQTTRALEISYALKRWSPYVTLLAFAIIVVISALLWRTARRWWGKTVLVLVVLLAVPPAWFARQNHFEWMFNPLKNSSYARSSDVDYLSDSDMVLAVKLGNEAVAYPVRFMAYHHLVQDTVGGVPVVATY